MAMEMVGAGEMRAWRPGHDRPGLAASRAFAVLGLLILAGCGGSPAKPKPAPPGPTTYAGAVAGPTVSGKLTITIAGVSTAAASLGDRVRANFATTGTFTRTAPGTPGTATLTGEYDDETSALLATGPGDGASVWQFSGGRAAYGLQGFGHDTTGAIPEYVYYSLIQGSTDVVIVLGAYTVPPGTAQTFNFAILGDQVHGNAIGSGNAAIPLDGKYVAATGDIEIANPSPGIVTPLARGKLLSDGTASGDYFDDAGTKIGTWSGIKQ